MRRRVLAVIGVVAAVSAGAYWYGLLPPSSEVVDPVGSGDSLALPLSPDLYGSPSRQIDIPGVGIGRSVEPANGPAPLVVFIAADSADRVALAGVQALLERAGIASVVAASPPDTAVTRALATWLELERIRRSRPVRLAVLGDELDAFLDQGGSAGGRDVVVLGAPPSRPSRIAAALARLPDPIRPAPDTLDARLVAWDFATVVVAQGDAAVASRLARGARRGLVLEIAAEELSPIPAHPDPERWRAVLQVFAGVSAERPEIVVGGDSVGLLPPID